MSGEWHTPQMTPKQVEIMDLIFKAADNGEKITTTDLYLKLSYAADCSRIAVYCSVNFLHAKWGLIEKSKRDGNNVYLTPTPKAYSMFRSNYAGAAKAMI